jgi:hypothetical protein
MHSEGRINQEGFSPLHSEGYIVSPASPPTLLADLFSSSGLFYFVFAISMFDVLAHSLI